MVDEINKTDAEKNKPAEKKPVSKKEKKGLFKRISTFFREYKSEMKKVVWCPKQDVLKNTGIVVSALLISGIVIGLLDLAFTQIILLLGGLA